MFESSPQGEQSEEQVKTPEQIASEQYFVALRKIAERALADDATPEEQAMYRSETYQELDSQIDYPAHLVKCLNVLGWNYISFVRNVVKKGMDAEGVKIIEMAQKNASTMEIADKLREIKDAPVLEK